MHDHACIAQSIYKLVIYDLKLVIYFCISRYTTDVSHVDPLAKVMFVLVSEVLEVRLRFGCRDDGERQDWMKWLMRATEQDFKPQMDDKKGGWGNGCGSAKTYCRVGKGSTV